MSKTTIQWTDRTINPIRLGAVFSACRRYRYLLERIWDPSRPLLVWVMLNPSKADGERDDATIRRCCDFARLWGYGGIVVANLFALVATYPVELIHAADPIGSFNDEAIEHAIQGRQVVCAWGNQVPLKYGERVQAMMRILTQTWTNRSAGHDRRAHHSALRRLRRKTVRQPERRDAAR